MSADQRFLRAVDGSHRNCPAEHWFEGDEDVADTQVEFDVPAGAVVCKVFSNVAAFFGVVAVDALDVAGAGFNAGYIGAGEWSIQTLVAGKSKLSVKAASGNLELVSVQWGGAEDYTP